MSILKKHEVWIVTDGQRYEEYDIKIEGNVITCYIASQAGKVGYLVAQLCIVLI